MLDGVRRLQEDLFEHGSSVRLQVDGGPAEYTIRVRFGLYGNLVLELPVSGPGEQPPGAETCVHRGKRESALTLNCFMQR